jgi:hypothetical protein
MQQLHKILFINTGGQVKSKLPQLDLSPTLKKVAKIIED